MNEFLLNSEQMDKSGELKCHHDVNISEKKEIQKVILYLPMSSCHVFLSQNLIQVWDGMGFSVGMVLPPLLA